MSKFLFFKHFEHEIKLKNPDRFALAPCRHNDPERSGLWLQAIQKEGQNRKLENTANIK